MNLLDLIYNLDSLDNYYPRHQFYKFDNNETDGLMYFVNFKDIVYIELDNETYKNTQIIIGLLVVVREKVRYISTY